MFYFLELLLYSGFLILDGTGRGGLESDLWKWIAVLGCFLQGLRLSPSFSRDSRCLTLMLAAATSGDLFLLFSDFPDVGLIFFLLFQAVFSFLLKGGFWGAGISGTIMLIMAAMGKGSPVLILAAGYGGWLICNLIFSWLRFFQQRIPLALAVACFLLALCDLHVALFFLYPDVFWFAMARWLFYLPCLVLLVAVIQRLAKSARQKAFPLRLPLMIASAALSADDAGKSDGNLSRFQQ